MRANKAPDSPEKYGVAFDEAATVFKGPNAISIYDPDHSETEDRWVIMAFRRKEGNMKFHKGPLVPRGL